jgi:hypothetical protein
MNTSAKILNKIKTNGIHKYIQKNHIQLNLRDAVMVQHIQIIKCNTAH